MPPRPQRMQAEAYGSQQGRAKEQARGKLARLLRSRGLRQVGDIRFDIVEQKANGHWFVRVSCNAQPLRS